MDRYIFFTVLVSHSCVMAIPHGISAHRIKGHSMDSFPGVKSLTEPSCMYRILHLTSFRLFGLLYWLLGFGAD